VASPRRVPSCHSSTIPDRSRHRSNTRIRQNQP
jgi:hypothetical protein